MTAMVDVQPPETAGAHHRAVARERRAAQTAHRLTQLLERRPELASACPLAALAVDAVLWSV
jgi:hypothetical protein